MRAKACFIITAHVGQESTILFCMFKEVLDVPPDKVYFYDGYGKEGKATTIYEANNIVLKQWFAIGKLEEINKFRDELLKDCASAKFKQIFEFMAPDCEPVKRVDVEYADKSRFVDELPLPCANRNHYKYKSCELLNKVHFDEFREGITKSLRSNTPNERDYAENLFPFKFISLPELAQFLTENICIVDEEQEFELSYHGERRDPGESEQMPSQFIGIITLAPIPREAIGVIITPTKLTNHEIIDSKIVLPNKDTGIFKITTDQPLRSGYLYLFDMNVKKAIAAERFQLIGKIDIQVRMSSGKNLKVFGELISIHDKKIKIAPRLIKRGASFSRRAFPGFSDNEYLLVLTKGIRDYLNSFGDEILIVDPYLLGKFQAKEGRLELSNGAKVFINALLMLGAEYEIRSVNFLCRREHTDIKESDPAPAQYKQLKDAISEISPLQIHIRFAREYIHDRYWLSLKGDGGIYTVGSSISNLANGYEFRIQPILDSEEQRKAKARFSRVWHESIETEVIL